MYKTNPNKTLNIINESNNNIRTTALENGLFSQVVLI